jgi:predicted SprT family Zn-dependent metalloprotease
MKYLIIGALVSILFEIVYARVRPYLKLIQKVVQSLNVVTEINTSTVTRQKVQSRNKLVRCDSCGTWIPAERALSLNSGLATYCSTECMTKPASKQRKLAG